MSNSERRLLREIAGALIPASAEFGMPAADDPQILAGIEKSIGRDLDLVRQALAFNAWMAEGGLATRPGVQLPSETIARGSGLCRNYAVLTMEAARPNARARAPPRSRRFSSTRPSLCRRPTIIQYGDRGLSLANPQVEGDTLKLKRVTVA